MNRIVISWYILSFILLVILLPRMLKTDGQIESAKNLDNSTELNRLNKLSTVYATIFMILAFVWFVLLLAICNYVSADSYGIILQ